MLQIIKHDAERRRVMKKITSIVIAMLIMITTVFADAQIPDFLKEIYTNYTADYSISVEFESSEGVYALLEKLEMPKEVSYYVDVKSLLKTLLSYDGKMLLQADFDENYEKMKLALTSESEHNIVFNSNLNVGVDAKMGMWMNVDLSDAENPVFDIIYSQPFMNKYLKISSTEIFEEEDAAVLKEVFNKEYIEAISKTAVELFSKHAEIKGSGSKYTAKLDNEALTSYIDELMLCVSDMINPIAGEEELDLYSQIPTTKGWQLLGKDGIQCVYTLSGGKISAQEVKADISIDIPTIYNAITGEEWTFDPIGTLDFTIDVSADVSKIGNTKVEFPVLTEGNSVSMQDLMPDYTYEEFEEETVYPLWYVSESCSTLPVVDGEIYVPLRQTLEAAYEQNTAIDYNNGVVTVTSEYFTDFNTLTVTVGSDVAYADDTTYTIGNVLLIDGTTYVNNKLFSDIFGWEFTYAEHNLMTNEYHYTFYTELY